MHVFAFLPVIIRLFLETSGASSARSMLRWVSVRQTEGGRGVGGSVNQNNTLSWCEIRLTTTLQIWTHTHTRSTLGSCTYLKINTAVIYTEFFHCSIFQCSPLLFCTDSCLRISALPFVCPSIHTLHTHQLVLPPSLNFQHIKRHVRWGRSALPRFPSVPGIPTANRNSAKADKTSILRPGAHERKERQTLRKGLFRGGGWESTDRKRDNQASLLFVDYQRSWVRATFRDTALERLQLLQRVQSARSCIPLAWFCVFLLLFFCSFYSWGRSHVSQSDPLQQQPQ